MKGINFLPGPVFLLTQYSFSSSTRYHNIGLFEANINNFKNFGTFHSLLRGKENLEEKSKDNTAGKGREIKTSVVNASQSNQKKKSLPKTKSLTVRPEINYNDLQIKVKQIQKFISKGMSISVKVDNPKNSEEGFEQIFSQIRNSIAENQISAKITTTGSMIIISPISTDVKADKKFKEEGSDSSGFNSESQDKS